jgi:hypothetical protein
MSDQKNTPPPSSSENEAAMTNALYTQGNDEMMTTDEVLGLFDTANKRVYDSKSSDEMDADSPNQSASNTNKRHKPIQLEFFRIDELPRDVILYLALFVLSLEEACEYGCLAVLQYMVNCKDYTHKCVRELYIAFQRGHSRTFSALAMIRINYNRTTLEMVDRLLLIASQGRDKEEENGYINIYESSDKQFLTVAFYNNKMDSTRSVSMHRPSGAIFAIICRNEGDDTTVAYCQSYNNPVILPSGVVALYHNTSVLADMSPVFDLLSCLDEKQVAANPRRICVDTDVVMFTHPTDDVESCALGPDGKTVHFIGCIVNDSTHDIVMSTDAIGGQFALVGMHEYDYSIREQIDINHDFPQPLDPSTPDVKTIDVEAIARMDPEYWATHLHTVQISRSPKSECYEITITVVDG